MLGVWCAPSPSAYPANPWCTNSSTPPMNNPSVLSPPTPNTSGGATSTTPMDAASPRKPSTPPPTTPAKPLRMVVATQKTISATLIRSTRHWSMPSSLVTDLTGSPQELIHPTTGNIVGTARHSLYGTRTWTGDETSPLLFAGQYLDDESGWAYNRFRYYHPDAGIYNAQDPPRCCPTHSQRTRLRRPRSELA